ncbi:MAG: DUF2442 domain-containing protein [Phormidesmis sp.]
MPTVFNEDGYRGMVHPNDHEPVHVHICKNGISIKIDVETFEVIGVVGGLPKLKEVKKAIKLTKKHKQAIEKNGESYMSESVDTSITLEDIERIRARSQQLEAVEHRAMAVRYDAGQKRLHIETLREDAFSVNVDLLQGVAGADDRQIANIEILPGGEGLYWPDLDASLLVHGICTGVYGSRRWMARKIRKTGLHSEISAVS